MTTFDVRESAKGFEAGLRCVSWPSSDHPCYTFNKYYMDGFNRGYFAASRPAKQLAAVWIVKDLRTMEFCQFMSTSHDFVNTDEHSCTMFLSNDMAMWRVLTAIACKQLINKKVCITSRIRSI